MRGPLLFLSLVLSAYVAPLALQAQTSFQEEAIVTSGGDLTITFIGHGTLMFRHGGKVVHVDPVGREADYAALPDADLILVTHEHGDHLDAEAIAEIRTDGTVIVVSSSCEGRVDGAQVMANGDAREVAGFHVEAVPAYNIVHMREGTQPFHPKGNGNGYIITFGDQRIYVAGDTENTPEMKALEDIDVAFLPMNLPYTMTPEMVADAARAFRPGILYPYHFGDTDPQELVELLADEEGIEVRVRDLS
ncbi:MBL fold metallo-hydrolase [Gemmatimonadota bacterium]